MWSKTQNLHTSKNKCFFADTPLTFTLILHTHSLPNRNCISQPKIRSTCTADKICGERRVHLRLHIFLTPMPFTPETQQRNPFKSSSEGIEAFTYHPITLIHAPGIDIQYENSAKSSYLSSTLNSEIRILSTCREQIEPWWKVKFTSTHTSVFSSSHTNAVCSNTS